MAGGRPSGAWLVIVATALACVGSARADIPTTFVDFHATWSAGTWTINNNIYGYDTPTWQANHLDLKVDNAAVDIWDKEVWLEVEWITPPPGMAPNMGMTQPTTGVTNGITAPTVAGDGFTWHWHIDPQPAEEWLRFPNTDFFNLQNINSIEVGTYCATKTIHKPEILYGHLDQHLVGCDACGPTSAINSFVYLEQAYPNAYDRKLVPDTDGENDYDESELISAAQTLGVFMGWDPAGGGVTAEEFILGKRDYILHNAPGTTVFDAQLDDPWDPNAADKPDWVEDDTYPTWEWLYEQLVKCEDIEILVWPDGGPMGHNLTLTSFEWLDDDDTILEEGEAKIDYIDPHDGEWGESSVWLDGGKLRTDYWAADNWIALAVSESIPEPATLGLLLLGALALLRRREA